MQDLKLKVTEQKLKISKLAENLFLEFGLTGTIGHLSELMIRYYNPLLPEDRAETMAEDVPNFTYTHTVIVQHLLEIGIECKSLLQLECEIMRKEGRI